MADSFKYRTDHVGSLLKSEALIQAEASGAADLRALQDKAVADAMVLQRDLSISAITDGQLRRRTPLSILAGIEGITRQGDEFYVSGPLRRTGRLAGDEARSLKSLTKAAVKVALPAPGMLAERLFRPGVTGKAYPTRAALGLALAQIIRAEVSDLIGDGVRYVQLDNLRYADAFADPERFADILAADTGAVQGIERPGGTCVGLYVGRGNAQRSALFEKANAQAAGRLLGLPVDRFVLDVDEAVEDFSVLRAVPRERVVALGLISTRTVQLEAPDSVMARIDQAAEHFDADNLALSPQTGFAKLGAVFCAADQKKKLELTASVATRFWGFGM